MAETIGLIAFDNSLVFTIRSHDDLCLIQIDFGSRNRHHIFIWIVVFNIARGHSALILSFSDIGHQRVQINFQHGVSIVIEQKAIGCILRIQVLRDFPVIVHAIAIGIFVMTRLLEFGPRAPIGIGMSRLDIVRRIYNARQIALAFSREGSLTQTRITDNKRI